MLKEPISESLLCLCALGLVHGDATLAAAALTELLKQGSASVNVTEQRCLLTCALLALQGNHSAGGAMAGHVACLSSMTHGKRALLYSGVNQLASGRHSGEDRHRNALKTMQRAVLLCPDDPATWAGLMAACHTENTSCYLSGSAPSRRGLEQTLMSVVSEKVHRVEETERPLAQALEGWVLKQAVSGLVSGGQLEQAEALCSQVRLKHASPRRLEVAVRSTPRRTEVRLAAFVQVLNVSPEHPAVMLSLRQVQCQRLLLAGPGTALPDSVLEQLHNTVMLNPTNLGAWHAVMAYRQSLQLASQLGLHSSQVASLLRLALLALGNCMAGVPGHEWAEMILEATTEVLKLGRCPMALLFQALLHYVTKMTARSPGDGGAGVQLVPPQTPACEKRPGSNKPPPCFRPVLRPQTRQTCLDMSVQMFWPQPQHGCVTCGEPRCVLLLHSEHASASPPRRDAAPPSPPGSVAASATSRCSSLSMASGAFAMPTTFTFLGSNTQSSSRPLGTAAMPHLGGTQAVS
ncbi:Tetratricopeptide repeat protein 37 [Liparis tanakae]|uniref:Tetratricopeptide repeat protein 37 n=1 Tax=Liparis tanakae TaxID=230148 RepID=A0A4Z2FNK9_9TELE|nr:Tetratricopeptide repeat protein 37 [Liparis tanakae]